MDRIDEMTNEDLARLGHSEHVLQGEQDRIDRLTRSHTMTGVDLSYWHERSRIVGRLLHEGSRHP